MIRRVDELPVVLTCFAYRREYFVEMEGMLATVREHHPNWPIVIGRGPIDGCDMPSLEIESPSGSCRWTLPAELKLDGGENDWRKITRMKGWWVSQVWLNFGNLAGPKLNRVIWLDADARLGGPLDIEIDPEANLLAGPWWHDPNNDDFSGIRSGILLFQGVKHGKIESLINEWSSKCLNEIRDLPPRTLPWLDGDQEILDAILKALPEAEVDGILLKLDHPKYCGHLTKYGATRPGTLVIHWLMSARMWREENSDLPWPPPEEYRREIALESFPRKPDDNTPGKTYEGIS